MTVTTPTVRTALRRARFWIVAAVILVVVAVAGLALGRSAEAGGPPLGASNPAPEGAMAVVEVLRQEGVDVTAAATLDAVRNAAGGPTTVLVSDQDAVLSPERLAEVAALADRLVLVQPDADDLAAVAPAIEESGRIDEAQELEAACALDAADDAGTIRADGTTYRVDGADTDVCFPSSGDEGVVARQGEVTVLGSRLPLQNETITQAGNAAFALELLGATETLVWYLPSLADAEVDAPPTITELTPPWLTPVSVLLLLAAVAAMVWRGRRFGPLVVEDLPVTVRASETMEGRARLYAAGSARTRALDSLRIGAIRRLAARCGLPRTATVDEVVAAVARLLGDDPARIRSALVDRLPDDDRTLVALSDELLTLERRVADAVRVR